VTWEYDLEEAPDLEMFMKNTVQDKTHIVNIFYELEQTIVETL